MTVVNKTLNTFNIKISYSRNPINLLAFRTKKSFKLYFKIHKEIFVLRILINLLSTLKDE